MAEDASEEARVAIQKAKDATAARRSKQAAQKKQLHALRAQRLAAEDTKRQETLQSAAEKKQLAAAERHQASVSALHREQQANATMLEGKHKAAFVNRADLETMQRMTADELGKMRQDKTAKADQNRKQVIEEKKAAAELLDWQVV